MSIAMSRGIGFIDRGGQGKQNNKTGLVVSKLLSFLKIKSQETPFLTLPKLALGWHGLLSSPTLLGSQEVVWNFTMGISILL
jgi:hypothetical protein